ncbi:MAG: MFS transporter [Pelovirga sp.]
MNNHNNISTSLLLRLFIPFGLGYAVSYLFRSVNAIIAPDLIAELGLSAADLGLLTSVYFLCFAAAQLPLGLLLDRYGSRRVEGLLLLFAAIGALCFSLSSTLAGLLIGRALIGLGVSACLMAAFKAFAAWLPKERLAFANGVQMVSGGIGALLATTPVELSLTVTDWRGLFLALAIITVIIAVIVFFVVPDQHQDHAGESLTKQLQGLRSVISSGLFWQIVPWAVTCQAAYLSLQGLWAGPWLRDIAGLNREDVAQTLWWIAIAMIVGYFVTGSLAERLGRRGIQMEQVAATGMCLFMASQLLLVIAPGYPTLLWISFGLLGTIGILPYAILAQYFPRHLTGRCNSVLNLLVFSGAFAAQWIAGVIIGSFPLNAAGGYSAAGYRAAFLTLLTLQVASALWFAWSRRRQ